MSFFNALLGAMNTGGAIYNDDKKFENTLIKDKASIDNTRANTALNRQAFSQNEKMNPLNIIGKENSNAGQLLNNKINQQSIDFNDQANPLIIKAKEIANMINQQSYDYNNQMNPLNIIGKELANTGAGYDNVTKNLSNQDAQRRLDDRTAFMANPDIAQSLKDAWQMNYATGGKSFNPSKGSATKPTILGTYNDAGFRTGNAVYDANTNTGIPINMQGQGNGQAPVDIQQVLGDAMSQTYGTQEFNSSANQADFNVRANEVYQSFLQQTNNPQQAQEMTKQYMFKQLGLDNDTEFGFLSDKELNYNPASSPSGVQSQPQLPVVASDEDFLALPKGSKFIDPNGNVRVK